MWRRLFVIAASTGALVSCKPQPTELRLDSVHPQRLGERVTITGSSLSGVHTVTFCGVETTFEIVDDRTIVATVTALDGLSGPCDVALTSHFGTGTLVGGFRSNDADFLMGMIPNPTPLEGLLDAIYGATVAADVAPLWGGPTPWWQMRDWLNQEWGPLGNMVEIYRDGGIEPIIVLAPITGPHKMVPGHWEEDDKYLWSQAFEDALAEEAELIAQDHSPAFMMIGNEVNSFWQNHHGDPENDPDDFSYFVSMYEAARQAVLAVSPSTLVFPSFTYNKIMHPTEDFDAVDAFDLDTLDTLVFTSYPFMTDVTGFETPDQIPTAYYKRIGQLYPNRKVGFTEVAWSSEEYGGNDEEQAEFIDTFFALTRAIPKEFVCYFLMNDFETGGDRWISNGTTHEVWGLRPPLIRTDATYWDWGLRRWRDAAGYRLPAPANKPAWYRWLDHYDRCEARPGLAEARPTSSVQ